MAPSFGGRVSRRRWLAARSTAEAWPALRSLRAWRPPPGQRGSTVPVVSGRQERRIFAGQERPVWSACADRRL